MKFVEKQEADEMLDLVCRMCPMHLLEPGDKLKCMKKGQILEVLTDYDQALEDIPEWCKKCDHEFIGVEARNTIPPRDGPGRNGKYVYEHCHCLKRQGL